MINISSDSNYSRFQFNNCIKEFKTKNDITLKKLFDQKDPQSLPLRKEFWSNHAIQSYLSRGSESIKFGQYHPVLETDRQNKLYNDYYESRIYQLAADQSWRIFPYRERVSSDQFYLKGCESLRSVHDKPFVRATECLELTRLIEVHKTEDIILTQANDIYKIRQKLLGFQHLRGGEARFFLAPNYKDGHATALISVLEKGADKLLVSIHIDSQNCKNFYYGTANGFVNAAESWPTIFGPELAEKYTQIKQELSGGKIKIDLDKRAAYLIDDDYYWFNSDLNSKQITAAEERNQVDVIHNIYTDDGEVSYRLFDRRPVTMINASNLLQTAKEDQNCAIYTFNTMQAVVKMLEDKEKSETVYQLALKIGYGIDEEKKAAEDALIKIFRDDIKAYLPCYFNADGTAKSESELQDFHLKERWRLGSLAASNESYLQYKKFLPD